MTQEERASYIERYIAGPARLEAALATVPAAAMQWRPAPDKWSAHEVVLHCADSESNGSLRIRYLVAEKEPVLMGYDQDEWARTLAYHELPIEPALATIRAVRMNAVPLLRRLTERDWAKIGRHTESGRYGAEDWVRIYSDHLETHAKQIERNIAAWNLVAGNTAAGNSR